MNERIFVVEDDGAIRELIHCGLSGFGYNPVCFSAGEEMFPALGEGLPELFVRDIMLPGMDGIEILKTLRKRKDTKNVPVIMLTAKTAETDKVVGLDAGANDYITKPFGILEFMARVRAALRSTAKREDGILSCGVIKMDTRSHRVSVNGGEVGLALKEYELLKLLLTECGHVIERARLLNEVWGIDFSGETRTLDMHVRSLRQKLGDDADNPRYIETVRGVGYMMRADK